MLTTIIKTKNSQDTIPETLESVKDLGDIIVLDEHSTDDTSLLAKEYKAQIIYSTATDFPEAFNQALNQAQNEWILFLEGDEIVPDKLGQYILNYIEKPKKNRNALYLPQKLFYLNREIKAYRKYHLKVFKKDSIELINNYSKELKPFKTKKHKLKLGFKQDKNCILKFEKRNIFAIFQNIIEQNIIKSKELNNKKASIFIKPFLKFLKLYLLKGAILEGRRGLIYSLINAIDCFISQCARFEYSKKEN